MKNRSILFLLLTSLFLNSNSAKCQNASDDPDLPSFAKFSKEGYLQAREAYISLKRGFNSKLSYNPRLKALQQMLDQQLRSGRMTYTNTSSANWVEIGPSPIPNGQTEGVSVAVSGRVTALAINNTNENIVYAGTANGGVFRTMDGGAHWTALFDAGLSLAIGALALAPDNTTLFVGTGESNLSGDSYAGVGLYRIDHADATPILVGPINPQITYPLNSTSNFTTGTFTFRSISKILIDPTNSANIFVSTSTGVAGNPGISPGFFVPPTALVGLYRSTNATAPLNSINFQKLKVTTFGGLDSPSTGNRRISDMVMDPTDPNKIICWVYGDVTVNDGGIFRTTNAKAANPVFTQVMRTTTSGGSRGTFSIMNQGGNVVVYAATDESPAGTGCTTGSGVVHKSIDGGITWSAKLNGGGGFCGGQCFYDMSIAVSPLDSNKVLLAGAANSGCSNIMQLSTNGGASFTADQTVLHADSHVVLFAPSNPSVVYTGNDGGVFKSVNGGTNWFSINNSGLKATQFQSLSLHPINPNFTIGGTQDNGTNMLKSDRSFSRVDFGDGGYTAIDQNATSVLSTKMYHTYFNQKNNFIAYVLNTSGETATQGTWSASGCTSNTPHNGITCTDNVLFYAPLVLGPGNPNTVYFGTDRLYRSANSGDTNIVVSQGPISGTSAITSIAISQKKDGLRIVGMDNGTFWYTLIGNTILTQLTPPVSIQKEIGRVAYDTARDIAFVTYGGYGLQDSEHVWRCTGFSTFNPTWIASGGGIPDVPVNAFAIDPLNSLNLYAGTDIGVYQSTDGGLSWHSFNTNLPAVPVFDMAVHPVTSVLRIATHGRGLWETPTLTPLPVTFISLTAVPKKFGKVFLEWFTSSEFNNKGFELQRALNTKGNGSVQWKDISFIPGAGNSNSTVRYNYDDYPTGGSKFLYRLKQIDKDNHFVYSDIKEVELRELDYALFQNAPNPSFDQTTIKYQLPVAGHVILSLYSSNGALIKTLVNEEQQTGIYDIVIKTNSLASGNYYYKITANDFTLTKQLNISK